MHVNKLSIIKLLQIVAEIQARNKLEYGSEESTEIKKSRVFILACDIPS